MMNLQTLCCAATATLLITRMDIGLYLLKPLPVWIATIICFH